MPFFVMLLAKSSRQTTASRTWLGTPRSPRATAPISHDSSARLLTAGLSSLPLKQPPVDGEADRLGRLAKVCAEGDSSRVRLFRMGGDEKGRVVAAGGDLDLLGHGCGGLLPRMQEAHAEAAVRSQRTGPW